MKKPRMLLEAKRKLLYKDMPVPVEWHRTMLKERSILKLS